MPYKGDENTILCYNSFSNALALIDKDKYEVFMGFVDNGVHIGDESLISDLKRGNFLIEDDVNELDRLRLRMLKSRYNTSSLVLTISPVSDCNFRCLYCYEKDVIRPDYMDKEAEGAIIKLVEGQMKTMANLNITWYGGEPLMNVPTIERLSRKFLELCKENKVKYNASMVTNGYLLDRKTMGC
jgi:uncharacterized protein